MPSVVEPKITYGDAGLEAYMRGLSVYAAIAAKRRASELQIEKMQLGEQVAEWRHEKDQEALQQTSRKIEDLDRFHSIENETRSLHEERLTKAYEDKHRQDQSDTQRLIDMQTKIYDIKAPRGTNAYQQSLDEVKDQFSDVLGTSEAKRIISPLEQQHKTARSEGFKAFNSRMAGLGLTTGAVFETPQLYQKGDKDGNMVFGLPDNKGLPHEVTVPKPVYDELKNKYREYYGGMAAPVPTPKEDLPSVPVISSKDDYDGLAPGSPFIWNGKRGIKPAQ